MPGLLIGGISALLAGAVALAGGPVADRLGRRLGWLDEPGDRKRHQVSIPVTGGILVASGLAAGCFAALLLGRFDGADIRVVSLCVAAAVVFAVGLLEDLSGCGILGRVAAQAAAASLVVVLQPVDRLGPVEISPLVGSILAVIWLVGMTNVINLLDGLDGLASGLACIVAAGFVVLGVMQADAASTGVAAALFAACGGFLRWNWRPARIFLGDNGALLIGFVLAWLTLNLADGASTAAGALAPFVMLGLPAFDTLLVAASRFTASPRRGLYERARSVVRADRRHLHHLLATRNGERAAVPAMLAFVLCACLLAVLAVVFGSVVLAAVLLPGQFLVVALVRRGGWRGLLPFGWRSAGGLLGQIRRLLPVLFLLAVAGRPDAATAQRGGIDDAFRSEARIQWGAVYLTPSFRLDRLGVDTNVFNTAEPQRDYVVAGTPAVDVWIPFRRRALLTTNLAVQGEYFHEFKGERSVNPDVRSRLDVVAGPLTFFAGGSRLDTRQRPSFDIDLRARRVETGTSGGVRVALASKLAVDLELGRDRVKFDGDAFFEGTRLAETLNREESAARVGFRWRATPLTTLVLAAESRRMRFDLTPDRDSDNLFVTLGGEFAPRAVMSGTAEVGVRRFEAVGSAVTDTTEVVARAQLVFSLPADVTAILEGRRDILYSFSPNHDFFVLGRYGVALRRRIGNGPFDLTGRFDRDEHDYLVGGGRHDVVRQHSVTLGYRLNQSIRIGLRVGDVRRTSSVLRGFEGVQAGLVFEYGE